MAFMAHPVSSLLYLSHLVSHLVRLHHWFKLDNIIRVRPFLFSWQVLYMFKERRQLHSLVVVMFRYGGFAGSCCAAALRPCSITPGDLILSTDHSQLSLHYIHAAATKTINKFCRTLPAWTCDANGSYHDTRCTRRYRNT